MAKVTEFEYKFAPESHDIAVFRLISGTFVTALSWLVLNATVALLASTLFPIVGAFSTVAVAGAAVWLSPLVTKTQAEYAAESTIHHEYAADAGKNTPSFFLKVSPAEITPMQISMTGLTTLTEEHVLDLYREYFEPTKTEYHAKIVWTDDSETKFDLIDVDTTYVSQFLWATFTEEALLEFWRASQSIATGSSPSSIGGQPVIDTRGLEGDAIGRRTQSQLGPAQKSPKPRTPGTPVNLFDTEFVESTPLSPQARFLARITR